MPDTVEPTHEALLRLCLAVDPKPWYPRIYARTSGVNRDSLDIPLNDLRLAGLIQLTEWEAGIGQGYILTDLGKEVLQNSAFLEQFKASLQTPPAETSPEAQPPGEPDAPTTYQRGETARKGYYEPEPPRVMPVLLILNLLTFGAAFVVAIRMGKPLNDFIFNGDAEVLHSAGALEATDLIHGEWWRLLTCCFLHFGLLHLGVNMYALYVLGGLEALWGSTRFLIIFCFSGLGGSCAAMIFNPGSPTAPIVLAGASGALWGLMLSLFAWVWLNRKHLPPQEVSARFRQYGFIVLLNVLVSTLPHVSAAAHFGGGVVGFLTGTLLHYHRFSVGPRRMGIAMLIAFLPALCFEVMIGTMANNSQWQQLIEAEERRTEKQAQQWFKDKDVVAVDRTTAALEGIQTKVLGNRRKNRNSRISSSSAHAFLNRPNRPFSSLSNERFLIHHCSFQRWNRSFIASIAEDDGRIAKQSAPFGSHDRRATKSLREFLVVHIQQADQVDRFQVGAMGKWYI